MNKKIDMQFKLLNLEFHLAEQKYRKKVAQANEILRLFVSRNADKDTKNEVI